MELKSYFFFESILFYMKYSLIIFLCSATYFFLNDCFLIKIIFTNKC